MTAPPVEVLSREPEEMEDIAREVVVAFVVVALTPVKFWRVVDPVARWLVEMRVVAVTVVANTVVDVAFVVVALTPVKFCKVEEARESRPPLRNERPETDTAVDEAYGKMLATLLVAVKLEARTFPAITAEEEAKS
jgi:hypothetical protein